MENSKDHKAAAEPPLDCRIGLIPRSIVAGGYKPSTVRFADGTPCCTSTYNYRMTDDEKHLLARRIAAALNLTRKFTVEQIESLVPNAKLRGATDE